MLLQNASEWNATGCHLGFFCQNNTARTPPMYCPPFAKAQEVRLAGGHVPAMGQYEPVLCKRDHYCPPGGKEQILCPAGSFCPVGSYKPTKCSFSANCPPGAYINRPLLPLFVLLLLDVLLIAAALGARCWRRNRKTSRKSLKKNRANRLTKAFTFAGAESRSKQYHNLEDGEVLHLESRISGVRKAPTGFLAAMDNDYAFDVEDSIYSEYVEKPDPDIQQFVQSLSKCTVAASFGLSFEFENLIFKPKGSTKPILSDVSGEIRSGTLWGIMGASGAGKSTFVNVLMGVSARQTALMVRTND